VSGGDTSAPLVCAVGWPVWDLAGVTFSFVQAANSIIEPESSMAKINFLHLWALV
jgi:hypothetical protein